MQNHPIREEWLLKAVAYLEPIFQKYGYQIPPIRVSVGFPSTGSRGRHLGQCWGTKASADGVNQIFISPQQDQPLEVLDTLAHELVHAVDDCQSGHGESFKKIATDIGMQGQMRSASAGEILKQDLIRIAEKLGHFPHAKLQMNPKGAGKSPSRYAAKCVKCGYQVNVLKRFASYGPPLCPKDRVNLDELGEWVLEG